MKRPNRSSTGSIPVWHELLQECRKIRPISYYRTPAGSEIDFIVETAPKRPKTQPKVVAIEVKRAGRWQREWGKPMLNFANTAGVKALFSGEVF